MDLRTSPSPKERERSEREREMGAVMNGSRRRWWLRDLPSIVAVLSLHVLALFAPFTFSWGALWTAVALSLITGMLGITLSYHRNLTHRSFSLPKWLEYSFAYIGVQAVQWDPIEWVSNHRYHHQFTDTSRDPHSPIEGFWFSHIGWVFDSGSIVSKCGRPTNVEDLVKQPYYQFLRRTYIVHPLSFAILIYMVGGFPFLVWGMGVRTVWIYHVTWLVNSACHIWGWRPWNTGDLSTNNWWVAIVSFGEGWHNNHHAFEYSARQGLKWWEVDATWYLIQLLQALGLATNVKVPSKYQMQRKALTTGGNNNGSEALKSA